MQTFVGFRPQKIYKDIFEFQRTGHSSLKGIRKVNSAGVFHLEPPTICNVPLPERFHANHFKAYPDVYLASLSDVRIGMVDFRIGIISADNGLLLDLSPDHAKKAIHPFLSYKDCRPQKTLTGRSLLLAAPTGLGNYYHWMFHVIGRLSVLKALEIPLESFDHIVINKPTAKFQHESLKDFNLPQEKLVFIDNGEFLKAVDATIPSYLYFHPMVPHFLRRNYLQDIKGNYSKKIYISRRKAEIRKLVEEKALVEMLVKDFGYTEIFLEDLSLEEQAKTLSKAEYVIAPHGAGVPNTIYCAPGTKVIEILPYSWTNVIYWIYGQYQKLNYGIYMAGDPNEPSNGYTPYHFDIADFKAFLLKHGF